MPPRSQQFALTRILELKVCWAVLTVLALLHIGSDGLERQNRELSSSALRRPQVGSKVTPAATTSPQGTGTLHKNPHSQTVASR